MTTHTRGDRATPILGALVAGPMTRQEIAKQTGVDISYVSDALCNLRKQGLVQRGEHQTWSRTSGAAVAPRPKKIQPQHVVPPRSPSSPLLSGSNGLRWFLGSDGSVRLEHSGAVIELQAREFDTLKRAHAVVKAAETEA